LVINNESKTEIQVDVPLTDKDKLVCSNEMISAMNLMSGAMNDMKDYLSDRKDEITKYEDIVNQTRERLNTDKSLSDYMRMEYTTKIVNALNAISEIEDNIRSYQTEKKAEISKYQAIINLQRSKINRGKDTKKIEVTLIKDFDAQTKTYVDTNGEIVKTLPLIEDDLQIELITP
jgi:hypothetical protein